MHKRNKNIDCSNLLVKNKRHFIPHLYLVLKQGGDHQWRRHHAARGTRAPHFYKWLGKGGGTVEELLITTMQ